MVNQELVSITEAIKRCLADMFINRFFEQSQALGERLMSSCPNIERHSSCALSQPLNLNNRVVAYSNSFWNRYAVCTEIDGSFI